jgi:hypothetical protein
MTIEELIREDSGDQERLRALLPMLQAQALRQEPAVPPAPITETAHRIGWPGNLQATMNAAPAIREQRVPFARQTPAWVRTK